MSRLSTSLPRTAMRGTLIAALAVLGACSSSGSSYNPLKRMGDSTYEKEQRQRGQEPRNPSHIEQQRRGGQDSGRAAPPAVPAPAPHA
jgi:hypothetical protein